MLPIIFFLFLQFPFSSQNPENAAKQEPNFPFQNSAQAPAPIIEEAESASNASNATTGGQNEFIPLRGGRLVNAKFTRPNGPFQGSIEFGQKKDEQKTAPSTGDSPQKDAPKAVAAELTGKDGGNGKGVFRKKFIATLGNGERIVGNARVERLELGESGNGLIRDGDSDGTAKRANEGRQRGELSEKPVGDELNGKKEEAGKKEGKEAKNAENGIRDGDGDGTKGGNANAEEEEEKEAKTKEELARKSEEFNTFSFLPAFFGRALSGAVKNAPPVGAQQNATTKAKEGEKNEGNVGTKNGEEKEVKKETEKEGKNNGGGQVVEAKPSGGSVQLAAGNEANSAAGANAVCEDLAENCGENRAFCSVSPYEKLMADNCAETCGKCAAKSSNSNGGSEPIEEAINADGGADGENNKKKEEGGECRDISSRCGQWAQRGFCSSRFFHRDLKARFCARTCAFCAAN